MAQMVFDLIQMGRQTVLGTAVAATKRWPGKATAWDLDRGYNNPDEDWGRLSDTQPGRATWGVRQAGFQLDATVRAEDVMDILEMHGVGGVVPTGIGPYTWTYTFDETSLTPKPYTLELGSETTQDQWRLTGCLITEVSLGFDALTAPGNSPWTLSARGIALDRAINALTALTNPATPETLEGHLTTLAEGTTATAFGALVALTASLVNYRLTSTVPYVFLPYGGTVDVGTDRGVSGKAGIKVEAGVKIGATSKSDIHDVLNAAGSVVQERRWRIVAAGSGTKSLTIDQRLQFETVDRAERAGEAIYGITGRTVYDTTLAGRIQIVSAGTSVASL